MSETFEKVSLMDLTRLERLELDEFLRTKLGNEYDTRSVEFSVERASGTIGHLDLWQLATQNWDTIGPWVIAWLAAKRMQVKFQVERKSLGEVHKKTFEFSLSPDKTVEERGKDLENRISDAAEQIDQGDTYQGDT